MQHLFVYVGSVLSVGTTHRFLPRAVSGSCLVKSCKKTSRSLTLDAVRCGALRCVAVPTCVRYRALSCVVLLCAACCGMLRRKRRSMLHAPHRNTSGMSEPLRSALAHSGLPSVVQVYRCSASLTANTASYFACIFEFHAFVAEMLK